MSCTSCDSVKDWDALDDKRCLRHRLEGINRNSSNHTHPSWDFVHPNLGKDPVRIKSKRQWKAELKKRGMVDDNAPRMDLDTFRKKSFDPAWDRKVNEAIQQSIAEVKRKPYSTIGKQLSHSDIQQALRRDRVA